MLYRSSHDVVNVLTTPRFMTHWDGLMSSNAAGESQRICILGATNRMQDIDEAILRRMPKKFPVSLPSAAQRRNIFKLILRDTKVDRKDLNLDYLVKLSAGMSGSDIKELCRDAAMQPVREYIKERKAQGSSIRGVDTKKVRGLRTNDFFKMQAGPQPTDKPDTFSLPDAPSIDGDEGEESSRHSGSTEEVETFDDPIEKK
jgi:ATPase family AAA domain-containing protein 1